MLGANMWTGFIITLLHLQMVIHFSKAKEKGNYSSGKMCYLPDCPGLCEGSELNIKQLWLITAFVQLSAFMESHGKSTLAIKPQLKRAALGPLLHSKRFYFFCFVDEAAFYRACTNINFIDPNVILCSVFPQTSSCK